MFVAFGLSCVTVVSIATTRSQNALSTDLATSSPKRSSICRIKGVLSGYFSSEFPYTPFLFIQTASEFKELPNEHSSRSQPRRARSDHGLDHPAHCHWP